MFGICSSSSRRSTTEKLGLIILFWECWNTWLYVLNFRIYPHFLFCLRYHLYEVSFYAETVDYCQGEIVLTFLNEKTSLAQL